MGSLLRSSKTDLDSIKVAVAWGTVTASFCCGGFGVAGLLDVDEADLQKRFDLYRKMLDLGPVEVLLSAP